ncbi:cupin domain-containing protein [Sedimentibacter sp.]|uniref:cupin domain-containing protein n=2 Tax=Sedimentibacter sp. TaxID=1960295 RepID=UPI0028ACF633|nr:cupin domain-containing protein [Sedimentibacter sp.]
MYNRAYQDPYYSNYPWYNYNPPSYNPYFINEYVFPYMPMITEMNDYINYAQNNGMLELIDYGPEPFVVNIKEATLQNDNFRTALWTGDNLQLTLMSIPVGEEIGLEMHPDTDQFIRIEDGQGLVLMGDTEDNLDFQEMVYDDFIFIIPAGKWHNLINMGNNPLKLYSLYAPPNHPHGTVHETIEIAEQEENL